MTNENSESPNPQKVTATPVREDTNLSRPHNSARAREIASQVVSHALSYEPTPLDEPRVDDEFDIMPAWQRIIEVVRYNLSCLGYRLAPNGWLRELTLLTGRLGLLMLIPIVAIVLGAWIVVGLGIPVMAGVNTILGYLASACASFATAMASLLAGVRSLLMAMVYAAIIIAALLVLWVCIKRWRGKRNAKRPGR